MVIQEKSLQLIRWLINHIVGVIFTIILTPFMFAFASYISSGNWRTWFNDTPTYIWSFFIVVVIGNLVVNVGLKAFKLNQVLDRISIKDDEPPRGWDVRSTDFDYGGVKWKIQSEGGLNAKLHNRNQFVASKNPLCPLCKTKLEESHRLLGGYKWNCINEECPFKMNSRDGFIKTSKRATKMAQRTAEVEGAR